MVDSEYNSKGYKVFNHLDGLIIISSSPIVSDQLHQNEKFFRYPLDNLPTIPIFVSTDLKIEVLGLGLPPKVLKFIEKEFHI